MPEKPRILSTQTLVNTGVFHIEAVQLRFSNGEERTYQRSGIRQGAVAVMIVPLLDKDTFLLIREYAAGIDDYTLAFPKGGMNENEDPLVTANRELKEEVGYGARQLTLLKNMSTSPNYMRSHMSIVLAEELYECREVGDEPEAIEVIPWKIKEIDALLRHEEFTEARSIAAVLLLERCLKNKNCSPD